jgi:hypothetical protein
VTFVLPFDDSDEEDEHDSDFENSPNPKEELDLTEEILLFRSDDLDPDSKSKEGTSFANIKEYLVEMVFVEPLKLPLIKIPIFVPNRLPSLKSHTIYNIRTRI